MAESGSTFRMPKPVGTPPWDRTPPAAIGGVGRPVRACQTKPGPASPGGGGVVAVQSGCVSSSVSGRVRGDRSGDWSSISAYAAMGAVPGPVWRDQESMTRQFLERLDRQSSLDNLDQCFPLQVLSVEASVREFYEFMGFSRRGQRGDGSASVGSACCRGRYRAAVDVLRTPIQDRPGATDRGSPWSRPKRSGPGGEHEGAGGNLFRTPFLVGGLTGDADGVERPTDSFGYGRFRSLSAPPSARSVASGQTMPRGAAWRRT